MKSNIYYAKIKIEEVNRNIIYLKGKISLMIELCDYDVPNYIEELEDSGITISNEIFDKRLNNLITKLIKLIDSLQDI